MTLSNFLTEAAVNYKIGSGNPEKMLYDFYVLSFISTINLSPEKSKTTTFGDIGFQGGFLSKADRVKEDIEYAQDVLLPVLKEKLIKGLFVSICAEIRHIKDRPQTYAQTPLATSKVFRDYYRTYTLLDKGLPKEFEPTRLREPKGATPNAASYKKSYQAAIKAIQEQNSTPYEFVKLCKYAFENMTWAPSYGGKNWGNICGGYMLLADSKTKDQVSVAIDHAYDLEHNTGAALNKVKDFYIVDEKGKADFDWMSDALDLKRDATSMKKLIDRCSGDMKRLALQAMALSPIDYMKKKTPAPEAVMQQKAQAVGGEYVEAFNEGAPKKYRVKTETKEEKPASGTNYGYPIAPVPFQKFFNITSAFSTKVLYYDTDTKCYVNYETLLNKKIPVVSVYAITHQTNINYLNSLINQYQLGSNLYAVHKINTIQGLDKKDIDNAEAAVNVSKKEDTSKPKGGHEVNLYKEVDNLPVVPKPQEALSNLSTITPDEYYYEAAYDTFVKIEALPGFSNIVRAFPVAVTSKTNKDKLKEAIIYNPKLAFTVSKSFVYELSYKDKVDLSLKLADSHAKDMEKKKPDLNVYIPKHKGVYNLPVVPKPQDALNYLDTISPESYYYETVYDTFVKIEALPGFSDKVRAFPVAVTSKTDKDKLKEAIIYKPKLAFNVSKSNVYRLSYKDKVDLSLNLAASHAKEQNKNLYAPFKKAHFPYDAIFTVNRKEIKREELYFDDSTNCYVEVLPNEINKNPISTVVTVIAITTPTNVNELIERIKNHGGTNEYLNTYQTKYDNIKKLLESDKILVSKELDSKEKNVSAEQKPNLNFHIPSYKPGDNVFMLLNRSVVGTILESYFENGLEMYKIKVIETETDSDNGIYTKGLTYEVNAEHIDEINPIYKVNDAVLLTSSGAEGLIVQTPSKQNINSNFIVKITKQDPSKGFSKNEEIVVNNRNLAPLKRSAASSRTNAIKKISNPGNIPLEAWEALNEKQKSILTPYKKDADSSYVFFTQKDNRTVGLYGKIQGVKQFRSANGKAVNVSFVQLLPSNEKSYFKITQNRLDDLKYYPSALKDVAESPLYNAPYQNVDAAPILKKAGAGAKIGGVYYDITNQQYVKIKARNNKGSVYNFYQAIPVAKTKFTPAYNTFNWGIIYISSLHLQELSDAAVKYLKEFTGDEFKTAPSETSEQKNTKEIPIEKYSSTDFLNVLNSVPLTKESILKRNQLYYDDKHGYVVKLLTTKKQFGGDSDTVDVTPMFKINIVSNSDHKIITVPKTYTAYLTDLHEFYD